MVNSKIMKDNPGVSRKEKRRKIKEFQGRVGTLHKMF